MKLIFIGAGFVGATTAAVMAKSGHSVLVFDINQERVDKLSSNDHPTIESCLYEEGLAEMLTQNRDHIIFSAEYGSVAEALETVDAIFVCVPTPQREDGSTDMQYYDAAMRQLSEALAKRNGGDQSKYVVVVNKSTVPIEAASYAKEILEKAQVKNFGVVSNPEFLVEGKAIEGNTRPSRIVVGAWNEKDYGVMRKIYERFVGTGTTPYFEVNPHEAAAGKLFANYLLFNRLMSCYGVIGRATESFANLNFENVKKVVSSDERFGQWGFYDSLYAGGSCLEKDVKSLAHQLQGKNKDTELLDSLVRANHNQLDGFLQRIIDEGGCELKGATVAVLGLAFKRDTNDMRNSAGPMVIEWLAKQGVKEIRAYDPEASVAELEAPEGVSIVAASSEHQAIEGTSAAIITADWPRFRTLAPVFTEKAAAPYCIADGRRMLQHAYNDLQEAGFTIIAVGSPLMKSA